MKEITEILKAAYHWGRDNGEGRSDKNFNDFLNTFVVSKLEHLVNQEVEKRIAERMPSEEDVRNELCRHLYNWLENNAFKDGCNWICSRLTCSEIPNNSKTEGGGE